ncbi:hypothetical protein DEU56DRAFT_840777 [Suillus clintonianus]|uniref:uncharacterized protein n=1 Tax=Suillus clintonianus TaxID=1904413 RepID=UPI001B860593|nr:uncharacterized protein DEU56DRAFT_840777 [Suillus clintonianus]KAG2115521.1 hypothetical protein DEU56DRAFT_840777 [Suillus clintonianus]
MSSACPVINQSLPLNHTPINLRSPIWKVMATVLLTAPSSRINGRITVSFDLCIPCLTANMRSKQLTIPTTPYPGNPSCSVVFPHSTDDAEPSRTKSDETVQILNYASFEIATALVHPPHFRQVINAPVHRRTSNTGSAHCGRAAEYHSRRALCVTREQAAYPCTPRAERPVARQAISMSPADPTSHSALDTPVGVSTMPRDRCRWSHASGLCNAVVSVDTLVVHMRKHVGGSSHRRIHCSWNGCGKLMRRDCLVRHIREIHLYSKRRTYD